MDEAVAPSQQQPRPFCWPARELNFAALWGAGRGSGRRRESWTRLPGGSGREGPGEPAASLAPPRGLDRRSLPAEAPARPLSRLDSPPVCLLVLSRELGLP